MARTYSCRNTHRSMVSGVCPWCRRAISNGGVKWHLGPRTASTASPFPPLTAEYGISLLAWEEDGSLHNVRRAIALELDRSRRDLDLRYVYFDSMPTSSPLIGLVGNSALWSLGAELAPFEVEGLERLVDAEPGALWLRAILVNSHLSRPDCPTSHAGAMRHAHWLIEHVPWSSLAAALGSRLMFEGEEYRRAKALWLKALDAEPERTDVLKAAAFFFVPLDRVLCGSLLRRGKALEPDKWAWKWHLGLLYLSEMRSRGDESRKDWAAMALYELLPVPEPEKELPAPIVLYAATAEAAFEADELETARQLAHRILADDRLNFWQGAACHLLGRIALKKGDVESAKAYLLDSAQRLGFPLLDFSLQTSALVRDLLARGEKKMVVEYLSLNYSILKPEPETLDEWVAQIERGEIPEFTRRHGR